MAKVSVIIPARNERYLARTIEGLFGAAASEIEVIAVLDGYWPEPPIADRDNLTLVHHTESIGMRSAINEAARLATGEYLLKCDAHCKFAPWFDTVLKADCEPCWTVVPRRYGLDAERWERGKIKCDYQYIRKEDFKGKDWHDCRNGKDVDDLMTFQGSCWFMHRQRFFDIDCLDDINYGRMGKEAQEISCKSWLSGGRVVVNKRTWYAHLDKAERGYKLSQETKDKSRLFAIDCWVNNKWPKQTRQFEWLIDRFKPPTWNGEDAATIKEEAGKVRCKKCNLLVSKTDNNDECVWCRPIGPWVEGDNDKANPVQNTEYYSTLRKSQLRGLARKRGISTSGLKIAGLITALERSDKVLSEYDSQGQLLEEAGTTSAGPVICGVMEPSVSPEAIKIPNLRRHFIGLKLISRIDMAPIKVRGFRRDKHLYRLFNEMGFKTGVEVGTKAGKNAERMCTAIPGLSLTVVDPWIDYGDDRRFQEAAKHEAFYQEAYRRLERFDCQIIRAKSMDAVGQFEPGSLDFVYIDGNHGFDYVMEDLIAWSRRVRVGGVVAGHDYYRFRKGGVVEAVNAYTDIHGIGELFICDEKCPSFFWRRDA